MFVGNIIALFTFGKILEVIFLSMLAFVFGCYWILRLRDWNAPGQVTWSMTVLTTTLFIIYTFLLSAFTPLNPLSFIFALIFFFLEAITLTAVGGVVGILVGAVLTYTIRLIWSALPASRPTSSCRCPGAPPWPGRRLPGVRPSPPARSRSRPTAA